MRNRLVVGVVLSFVVLTGLPAQASVSVSVADFSFTPAKVKVAQGGSVTWHNAGAFTHTSTENGPLSLWNTGKIAPGSTSSPVTLRAAGSYPYHCAIHASMKGVVKVPIRVSPASGTPSTTFTITVASATQSGFTYDVQRKVGSGAWMAWKSGLSSRTVSFSGAAGTYRFRSRLHRTSTGATSGWSPAQKITVSA